ncbi:RRM domain-containing protein [Mycena sanguinolenta]|uniref:RRM domain-containing protein n=1 Tax=Mycena sanguinolenta TaxID=230812 RepID=A0A8H7DH61_9AGAR|nr:RRM domain-containing protein [Mycena sanguinolenta]
MPEDDFDIYGEIDTPMLEQNEGEGEQVETLMSTPETALGDKRPRDDEEEEGADMNVNQPPSSSRPSSAPGTSSSSGNGGAYTAMPGQTPNNQNGSITVGSVNDALYIGDLQWWTTDEDLRQVALNVNGKSKGIAYVECGDYDNAMTLKTWFDNNDFQNRRAAATLTSSAQGNPFRTLPKEPPPRDQRMQQQTPQQIQSVSMPSMPMAMAAAGMMGRGGGGNFRGGMRGGGAMNGMMGMRGGMPGMGMGIGAMGMGMPGMGMGMGGMNMMSGFAGAGGRGGIPQGPRGGGMMRGGMGMGMVPTGPGMGRGGNFANAGGHFNPAFMQGQTGGGQQFSPPDGPRKRYRVDESG